MKKILVIVTIITLGLIGILFNYQNNNDKAIYESSSTSNNKIVRSNALTMMYETEAGSGEYQVTSDTTWPQEGYVFNDRLSKCENGSELSWDDENKRVIVSTSVSDKCYVYFDVYAPIFSDYIINDIYIQKMVKMDYTYMTEAVHTEVKKQEMDHTDMPEQIQIIMYALVVMQQVAQQITYIESSEYLMGK